MSDLNTQHNRVVWFDIPVADLNRAADFYATVLDIQVSIEQAGDFSFGVLAHEQGNGGCLVPMPSDISATQGIMVYFNVNGRIQDAVKRVTDKGGSIIQAIHAIGPHGFRALVIDSEGNRIVLHSETNQ
ncbi:VOC family protein [Paraglaciecola aestuariivivens]